MRFNLLASRLTLVESARSARRLWPPGSRPLATDVVSFAFLEPQANGFRNYLETGCVRPPAEALDSDARGLGVRLELRAALHRGEFYASNDSNEKFAQDFVKAWN